MNKSSRDKYEEYASVVEGFRTHGKGLGDVLCRVRRIVEDSDMGSAETKKASDLETRFSAIRNEISELINSLSSSVMVREESLRGPPVIVRCKQWDDYKLQALNANTVSFLYRAEEKAFQVDALKEGRVYTYSGQMPNDMTFLRAWLSRELCVEENRVLEGILAIG
ncbi:hypothetical protein A3K79_00820 [Candidatus Bathyarchaeota archaeon RBG_13_46_16b]|nr:MAG: hypothetical protein A3K79_00820 [Candidatus Bathyarchaeota archaeon RBG_13_46_16b]